MKKGVFLMILCLLVTGMAAAEEKMLYPILEYDLWGYMNRQGQTVIPAVYDRAEPFMEDGFAVVGKNVNKKIRYGLIDRDGNEVLPCIYGSITKWGKVYTISKQDENGEWKKGFYNTENGFLQKPQYDEVYVQERLLKVYIDDCYGFISFENGEIVIPVEHPWTPYAAGEQDGYLFLTEGGGCGDEEIVCRLMDENMNEIIFPDGLMPAGLAKEGVVPVERVQPKEAMQNASAGENSEMGLARVDGTLLHEAEFDYVYEAQNGVVPFWDNDLCGHMDLEGNVVVPAKYAAIDNWVPGYVFDGDYALIQEHEQYVVIDKQGDEVFTADRFTDNGILRMDSITEENLTLYRWDAEGESLYGLIKFGGEETVLMTENVFEIVHFVKGGNGLYPARQNGLYGFIDENGQWVLPPYWDDTEGFVNGLAWVEKDCKAAYIDREGNVVWQETRE